MENLEVIRSATSDGSSRRFSLALALALVFALLFALAAMIHLILLSTTQYKWLDGMSQSQYMQSRTAQK